MQVGSAAMKENHVSLEEMQQTLSELDEAITLQRETEEALGMRLYFHNDFLWC
jgi:hypothetical protein